MFEVRVRTEEGACCLGVEARCKAEVFDIEEGLEGFEEFHVVS